MYRFEIAEGLRASGIVGIVRTRDSTSALHAARAMLDAGLRAVEVTLTFPGALTVVEALAREAPDDRLIGAGTVLDAASARAAILSGARFLVSPNVTPEVIAAAGRYGCASVPGAATPTEVVTALEAGADLIKLFPGKALGISTLRAIRTALPQAPLVPTGGIDANEAEAWFEAGAVAVGMGSALISGDPDRDRATVADLLARIGSQSAE